MKSVGRQTDAMSRKLSKKKQSFTMPGGFRDNATKASNKAAAKRRKKRRSHT